MYQISSRRQHMGPRKGKAPVPWRTKPLNISLLQRVLRDFLPNRTNSSHFLFFCHLPLLSRLSFCLSIYKLMAILSRIAFAWRWQPPRCNGAFAAESYSPLYVEGSNQPLEHCAGGLNTNWYNHVKVYVGALAPVGHGKRFDRHAEQASTKKRERTREIEVDKGRIVMSFCIEVACELKYFLSNWYQSKSWDRWRGVFGEFLQLFLAGKGVKVAVFGDTKPEIFEISNPDCDGGQKGGCSRGMLGRRDDSNQSHGGRSYLIRGKQGTIKIWIPTVRYELNGCRTSNHLNPVTVITTEELAHHLYSTQAAANFSADGI
ncbi:hypothetical protein M5K25_005652 [Dendrobium thyrsiflorum]|uniref:Uncharacterized protein n=1 Tax=Dendrobium thyrsiflorum TaxID=117978 RepID=A0ABD0VIB6_DENTH